MAFSWCSRCREIIGDLPIVNIDALPDDIASVRARFQVGDATEPQYALLIKGQDEIPGHLTWDPAHHHPSCPFYSVACVNLDVSLKHACWSVGTNDFLQPTTYAPTFTRITEVWVTAKIKPAPVTDPPTPSPQRIVQWNSLDLTLIECNGHWETFSASSLPMAVSTPTSRCAVAIAPDSIETMNRAQVARFRFLDSDNIDRIQIKGQVTLVANCVYNNKAPLASDDLVGKIFIFTNCSPAPTL